MFYPVSEERCSKCDAKSLVTRSVSYEPLPEEQQYFQCLGGVEADCAELEQNKAVSEEMEDSEMRAFMRELDYTVNNMDSTEWC